MYRIITSTNPETSAGGGTRVQYVRVDPLLEPDAELLEGVGIVSGQQVQQICVEGSQYGHGQQLTGQSEHVGDAVGCEVHHLQTGRQDGHRRGDKKEVNRQTRSNKTEKATDENH